MNTITARQSALRLWLYFAIGMGAVLAGGSFLPQWARELIGAVTAGLTAIKSYIDVSAARIEPAKTGTAGT